MHFLSLVATVLLAISRRSDAFASNPLCRLHTTDSPIRLCAGGNFFDDIMNFFEGEKNQGATGNEGASTGTYRVATIPGKHQLFTLYTPCDERSQIFLNDDPSTFFPFAFAFNIP
jgi:hypothetical protein